MQLADGDRLGRADPFEYLQLPDDPPSVHQLHAVGRLPPALSCSLTAHLRDRFKTHLNVGEFIRPTFKMVLDISLNDLETIRPSFGDFRRTFIRLSIARTDTEPPSSLAAPSACPVRGEQAWTCARVRVEWPTVRVEARPTAVQLLSSGR